MTTTRPVDAFTVQALDRYWPRNKTPIEQLPVLVAEPPLEESLPPRMVVVALPDWAMEIGVDGGVLVPVWTIGTNKQQRAAWERTDWLSVAFWYLNGTAERAHEKQHGPIHSYSFRLKEWDSRLWERAWVNRIALFLRRWAARVLGQREEVLFGPLPSAEIIVTHDVDAVSKTMAIRFKQTAFHIFNAARHGIRGHRNLAFERIREGKRFFLSRDDYWCFDKIIALEEKYGVRSHFNFYGGMGGWRRNLKQLLLDPAYNVLQAQMIRQIRHLHQGGWVIGLHQ